MADAPTPTFPVANRLLAALPAADYAQLAPQLESVALTPQQVIHAPHQPMGYVYFPQHGVVSLVAVMADGSIVEVAMIGHEGLVGLPVFFGSATAPTQAFVHIAGHALRMPVDRFQAQAHQSVPLQDVLRRYTQTFMTQITQVAACHRLHPLSAQFARWLLMIDDRVGHTPFPLTQAFLAQLQGLRRARINAIGRRFRQARLIHYTRGRLTIRNRTGLAAIACECYEIISREYARLLG